MNVFSLITLAGGLAFFLYGMHVMSTGLEKMAGGKLEGALKKMTSNPFKSLLLGAGITIAIQSSSAMTVMLVGLVNSGIMELGQTIGVIMGSNIGTTLTAWLLSMVGIESDNFFLTLLKPENFSLIFAFVGVTFIMMSKDDRKKDIGSIFVGFAVLMFGMRLMSDAVSPLADMPGFSKLLVAFENPILGVLVGAVFTGIIQSSAASIGILQALALTGSITYGMAIPIIMGQNIGTCVTALISSIGVNRNAKKVAVVHISFNLIGTIVCLIAFYAINAVVPLTFIDQQIGALGIAAVHSIFNITTTAILLPFSKQLERIANLVLHDAPEAAPEKTGAFLDERLLATPSVAISECNSISVKMAALARDTLLDSIAVMQNYTDTLAQTILKNEDMLDGYEDQLSTYLVRLSSKALSDEDTKKISKMLHAIGDFERLGDHAVNILRSAKELHDKGLKFSEEATMEVGVLTGAIGEILTTTTDAYAQNDIPLSTQVEPLEQVIDQLIAEIRDRHIRRLQRGSCTIEMGFILSDLLSNFGRVSDHCSNIAVAIIEVNRNSFDTHQYLNAVKYGNSQFNQVFGRFEKKYSLK